MARNSEKAMTALARWRQLQLKEQGKLNKERRPYLASEEFNLKKAEKWRQDVIREIAKKVTQIQNAGLGEFRIRDINDEINKLLYEKRHWEDRIVELGGPDYQKIGPKMLDREGKEVASDRGYKYFGAAKDLPGVRELFEQEPPVSLSKTRGDLMRNVDAHYYGYLDEDDDHVLEVERKAEAEARCKKIKEWNERYGDNKVDNLASLQEDKVTAASGSPSWIDIDISVDHRRLLSHVPVISKSEIEKLILQRGTYNEVDSEDIIMTETNDDVSEDRTE
ncbi:hypothetical protein GJ496_009365 [Pomphorhynchus laevis]|nr:hypothetical protein GJ496_009365 [Pomphorhynchus laevis]